MYARSPDPNRQSVKIPENYGGHAFRSSGTYSDMPPPARIEPLQSDEPPSDTPRASAYGEKLYSPPSNTVSEDSGEQYDLPLPALVRSQGLTSPSASIFSSLIPPSTSAAHFPFGHGLGSEELLIIAMMLMVYLADGESADNELLLLLGLLLFAG